MTIEQVIQLIKSKNEKGLETLYESYGSTLLGIISKIIPHQETAEEVLQQTYLKVWNNIDSYDANKASFFTWMSTIARNASIDKTRLKSFQKQHKTDSIDNIVFNIGSEQNSTAAIDVNILVDKMDAKYKQVLDYVYLRGHSHQEASKHLDIPLGTVKTRLRFAINILRTELKDEKGLFFGALAIFMLLILLLWN